MFISGACHCGSIKYQAAVNPEQVIICHCEDCQQLSGSAFRTVVMSKEVTFIQGTPKEYIKIAESGNRRAQGFCGDCGSALYATSVDHPSINTTKVYGLRVGTIKEKNQLTPKVHIWCRSAQAWLKQMPTMKMFDCGPN
nr:GFA family protein [Thalassotalea atypica]